MFATKPAIEYEYLRLRLAAQFALGQSCAIEGAKEGSFELRSLCVHLTQNNGRIPEDFSDSVVVNELSDRPFKSLFEGGVKITPTGGTRGRVTVEP